MNCFLCWLVSLNDRDLYFRKVDWSKAEHSKNCINKYKKTKYRLITRFLVQHQLNIKSEESF
jgi:hypothetical protein